MRNGRVTDVQRILHPSVTPVNHSLPTPKEGMQRALVPDRPLASMTHSTPAKATFWLILHRKKQKKHFPVYIHCTNLTAEGGKRLLLPSSKQREDPSTSLIRLYDIPSLAAGERKLPTISRGANQTPLEFSSP